jgi:hypothetical protein
MSAVAETPIRTEAPFDLLPQLAPMQAPEPEQQFSSHEVHRWALVLLAPFVVGAAFFGLAIGLDAEWPIAPAFLLGPLVMISAYIYLSLDAEANTTS